MASAPLDDARPLALTGAIIAGKIPDEVIQELERHFDHAQRVELTETAAFYAIVPRILDAPRVPVEDREPVPLDSDGASPDAR